MRIIITSQERLHKYKTGQDNEQKQDYTPMSGLNPSSWASNIKVLLNKLYKNILYFKADQIYK